MSTDINNSQKTGTHVARSKGNDSFSTVANVRIILEGGRLAVGIFNSEGSPVRVVFLHDLVRKEIAGHGPFDYLGIHDFRHLASEELDLLSRVAKHCTTGDELDIEMLDPLPERKPIVEETIDTEMALVDV